jgi:toxin ParE1/3/4
MAAKPILVRVVAGDDMRNAVGFYEREAGARVASRFADQLVRAFRKISAHPKIGSPRYADQFKFEGLRHRQVHGFPYLIFYAVRGENVEVFRVLHSARDIPQWLVDPADG